MDANFPLDDLKDEPCLLIECPTLLAVKLFQHTMKTLKVKVKAALEELLKQKVKDDKVSYAATTNWC